ncbi:MAG: hypothetical protein U0271_11460 [Polyangiaceae bacterium]
MSFLVLSAVAAAVAAGAGFAAARLRSPRSSAPPEDSNQADKMISTKADPTAELVLALDDVVSVEADDPSSGAGRRVRVDRWLAGAVVAFDGKDLVGALYAAPEGVRTEFVSVLGSPRRDIGWLSRSEVSLGKPPPTTVEIEGRVLTRKRRLMVRFERLGRGAPNIGSEGVWAEYEAEGGIVAVALIGASEQLVACGMRYEAGEYDRIGKGAGS